MIEFAFIKRHNFTGNESKTFMCAKLFAALKKKLHPQTDTKQRFAAFCKRFDSFVHAVTFQMCHCISKGSDTRQNELIITLQFLRITFKFRVGTYFFKCVDDRSEVTHVVVDDAYHADHPFSMYQNNRDYIKLN